MPKRRRSSVAGVSPGAKVSKEGDENTPNRRSRSQAAPKVMPLAKWQLPDAYEAIDAPRSRRSQGKSALGEEGQVKEELAPSPKPSPKASPRITKSSPKPSNEEEKTKAGPDTVEAKESEEEVPTGPVEEEDEQVGPIPEALVAEEAEGNEFMVKEEAKLVQEAEKRIKGMTENELERQLEFLLNQSEAFMGFMQTKIGEHTVSEPKEEDKENTRKRSRGKKTVQEKDAAAGAAKQAAREADAGADGHAIPSLFKNGELRPYQVDGYRWMKTLFYTGINGILADEMGLGKTVQAIAMIAHLYEMGFSTKGPTLVVAPLSTLPNWTSEFKRFTPDIPVVLYHGTKDRRAELRTEIMTKTTLNGERHYPVIITSYQIISMDVTFLLKMKYTYFVMDEGHRIKNFKCRLLSDLKRLDISEGRLLLTGTPLQNDLTELWSLLNFILPVLFDDLDWFTAYFDFSGGHEAVVEAQRKKMMVSKLHAILKPILLRRMKVDVELNLPPKRELIVYAPLTRQQEELYRLVIDNAISANRMFNDSDVSQRKILSGKRRRGAANYVEEKDDEKYLESIEDNAVDLKTIFDDPFGGMESMAPKGRVWEEGGVWRNPELDTISRNALMLLRQICLHPYTVTLPTDEVFRMESMAPKGRVWEEGGVWRNPELDTIFRNALMLLRQICLHPYTVTLPTDEHGPYTPQDENVVMASGKMRVMDQLLRDLKAKGHKVLLFSQFKMMLNILEVYCQHREWNYVRLDGSTNLDERAERIAEFNKDKDTFIFLISTRAGNLGMNLCAADTVIIYDSDWNPQSDLQAQDRCHRIGQDRPVVVYRITTKGTVDEKIVSTAIGKRKVERTVIGGGTSLLLPSQDRCHRIGQDRPVVVYRITTKGTVDEKIVSTAIGKRKVERTVIGGGTSLLLPSQDRCHRIGQDRPVVVYRITTKGTVDEKIVSTAIGKRKVERTVIGGGTSLLLPSQDRCHRIGQDRPVVVYRITTKGTVDEKIVSTAIGKRKVERTVIGGGTSLLLPSQDRCHRIGQDRPVVVYRITTKGTVDEKIVSTAIGKRKVERTVIGGGTSLLLPSQDRCHRIGQDRPVVVYRITTKGTVDEKIVSTAIGKRKVERTVIGGGKFNKLMRGFAEEGVTPEELAEMLEMTDHSGAVEASGDIVPKADMDFLLDRTFTDNDKGEAKSKTFQVVKRKETSPH